MGCRLLITAGTADTSTMGCFSSSKPGKSFLRALQYSRKLGNSASRYTAASANHPEYK